ncbi:tetraspanin-5-like isoform X2 [Amphiura filiformis]|uniref:tetraspanin-5-like isoform X2 n=1 Tax=Amphiura filiformis TaxID=82378 RepID=UPI003B212C88
MRGYDNHGMAPVQPQSNQPQQRPPQGKPPPYNPQHHPHQPPPQQPKVKVIPRNRRPRGAPPGVEISFCVKYTIFFLNLAFWLIGAFILGFGIWGLVTKSLSTVNELAKDAGFSLDPMIGFIIIGGIIFSLAFCGCIGALRENTCILKFFTYSLILIFIGEIVIGVLGYIYSDKLLEILEVWMFRYIDSYFDDPDTQFIVDGMQEGLKCCGSVSPDDWLANIYFACDSIATKTQCSVPFSCCKPDEGIENYQCGYGVLALDQELWRDYIHTQGCVEALQYWFIEYAIVLGCVGGVLIILQCVTICLAKSLIADIETVKSYW